jgi:type IV pilus assembly protein PilA
MRRIFRGARHGQRGFTLIELLIVVAILGVLAAVIIPNVGSFMGSARMNAANTELQNVRTAAIAYMADNAGVWPTSEDALMNPPTGDPYLTGTMVGTYSISQTTGEVTGLTYPGCYWGTPTGGAPQWLKGTAPAP